MSEPLFKSAHQALTFAYNFSQQSLDRPLMNRMADKYKPTGRGLSGQDGSGQAGMILRRLEELKRLHQMVLIARFAPQTKTCICCGGEGPHHIWMGAVREIAFVARGRDIVPASTKPMLADGLVARYFGQRVHLQQLAKQANVAPNTVTKYRQNVVDWLHGTRYSKKGKERDDGMIGQEHLAIDAAEAVLLDAGIIGSMTG